jgi:hypothetical protein
MPKVNEVKVNEGEWKGLSAEDKAKIQSIIQAHFPGTKVVGNKTAKPSADALSQITVQFSFKDPLCSAACGIAEAGAVAACALLPNPIAVAMCVAAAHAAGDFCRSKCPK